jgi:hypothetical protein
VIRFDTIEAFYEARGGARSGESDFGVWWSRPHTTYPRFRVSVVHDTGDIYAYNETTRAVELLGTLSHSCDVSDSVTRHPATCAYTIADEVLEGWANAIGSRESLRWVTDRLAAVPA